MEDDVLAPDDLFNGLLEGVDCRPVLRSLSFLLATVALFPAACANLGPVQDEEPAAVSAVPS